MSLNVIGLAQRTMRVQRRDEGKSYGKIEELFLDSQSVTNCETGKSELLARRRRVA